MRTRNKRPKSASVQHGRTHSTSRGFPDAASNVPKWDSSGARCCAGDAGKGTDRKPCVQLPAVPATVERGDSVTTENRLPLDERPSVEFPSRRGDDEGLADETGRARAPTSKPIHRIFSRRNALVIDDR